MMIDKRLTLVKLFKPKMIVNHLEKILKDVSGMNASLIMEKITNHAQTKMLHTVFKPMDNSIQECAVATNQLALSVYQIQKRVNKIEIFLNLASFNKTRDSALPINYANG